MRHTCAHTVLTSMANADGFRAFLSVSYTVRSRCRQSEQIYRAELPDSELPDSAEAQVDDREPSVSVSRTDPCRSYERRVASQEFRFRVLVGSIHQLRYIVSRSNLGTMTAIVRI